MSVVLLVSSEREKEIHYHYGVVGLLIVLLRVYEYEVVVTKEAVVLP